MITEKAIFNSLTLLSLFLITILITFFLITIKGKKSGNNIMTMLLTLFSIQIFYSFSISEYGYSYFIEQHKLLFIIRQTALLTGPFIYFYVQTYYRDNIFRLYNLLHIIPFVASVLFLSIYYSTLDRFIIWESSLDFYNTLIIFIVNLTYILFAFKNIRATNFSIASLSNRLKSLSFIAWLRFILLGFIIVWILNLNIFAIYMITKKPVWCAYSRSIYMLAIFTFLCAAMLILMLKPEIYSLVEKYKNTPVDEDNIEKHKQKLIQYMNNKRPYLIPDITIEIAAKDLSINTRTLSQIINESFQNNFNGYMNEFRIRECLKQLSDISSKKTILEILYDSGFNSKSTFYAEFRKHTNQTPLEYRAMHKKQMSMN